MIDWNTIGQDEINSLRHQGAATTKTNVKERSNIENHILYLHFLTEKNGEQKYIADQIINKITPLCQKIGIEEPIEIDNIYKSVIDGLAIFNSKNTFTYVKKEDFSDNLIEESRKIYETGKFVDFILETWNKEWYQDTHIIQFVLLQAASNYITNPEDGLHLYVAGNTGLGKSMSVEEALTYLPPTMQVTSKFTPQWLYYGSKNNRLTGKQILFTDDTTFGEEFAGNLRNMLSGWLKGVTKDSVGKDGEPLVLQVPPRITLILTSVDGITKESHEGQDESRYTTMEIKRNKDDITNIKMFMQTPKPDIKHEKEIIQGIWSLITDVEVECPYKFDKIDVYKHSHGKIEESIAKHNLGFRELKKYRTMVMANALLHNRTVVNEDDIRDIGKILTYCNFMIKNDTPGFTQNEMIIKEVLEQHPTPLTIAEITMYSKLTQPMVYTALRGKNGNFDNPKGGLLSKGVNLDIFKDNDGRINLKIKSMITSENMPLSKIVKSETAIPMEF